MPPLKQMIKRSDVEVAKAKRTCQFSNRAITKGSACLVLFESPRDRYCYSQAVALDMIRRARERLDELESLLAPPS